MSNHLAIATVTVSLGESLHIAINQDLGDVDVKYGPPQASEAGNNLHVFLYHVTTNPALSNANLPTRASDGRVVSTPRRALDLHYLLTFNGDELTLLPQRMMGSVIRRLESVPILTRQFIREIIANETFSPILQGSDLANAIETVSFTPEAFSLEDLSKLWSVFFQIPYALSVAYRASVVLIDGVETPQTRLPVQQRSILVFPSVDAAGATVVRPDQIDGLQLWLKADTGVTYDAAGVSAWADQSGNGYDAGQTAISRRPAFAAHGIGTKPVVRFDGADDFLAIDQLQYSNLGEIGAITICMLVRTEVQDTQVLVDFGASDYYRLSLQTAAITGGTWDTVDTDGDARSLSFGNGHADGRWHLICARFEATSTPDNDKRLFVDGVEGGAENAHGGKNLGTGSVTSKGFIGAEVVINASDGTLVSSDFLHGDVAELLIYQAALSDQEREAIERYFVDAYQ